MFSAFGSIISAHCSEVKSKFREDFCVCLLCTQILCLFVTRSIFRGQVLLNRAAIGTSKVRMKLLFLGIFYFVQLLFTSLVHVLHRLTFHPNYIHFQLHPKSTPQIFDDRNADTVGPVEIT